MTLTSHLANTHAAYTVPRPSVAQTCAFELTPQDVAYACTTEFVERTALNPIQATFDDVLYAEDGLCCRGVRMATTDAACNDVFKRVWPRSGYDMLPSLAVACSVYNPDMPDTAVMRVTGMMPFPHAALPEAKCCQVRADVAH